MLCAMDQLKFRYSHETDLRRETVIWRYLFDFLVLLFSMYFIDVMHISDRLLKLIYY